jgi:hypothetical protein
MQNEESGNNNIAIGYNCMPGNITGVFDNTILGFSALISNTLGSSNTGIGRQAGFRNNGSRNVFIGDSAGEYATSSNDKLFIGNSTNTELIEGDFANDSINLYGNTFVGKPIYTYSSSTTPLLSVQGDVSSDGDFYSMGFDIGSDERLKTNIQPLDNNALSKILQLNSRTFEYDKAINPSAPKGEQIGYIAQELNGVFPELVAKGGKYYAVNYIGLIPVITQAMKEQQTTIDSLRSQLNTMQTCVDNLCAALQNANNSTASNPESIQQVTLTSINHPILYQNAPNPFGTGGTKISYFLPQGTMGATIVFFDNYGNKLKELDLNQTGIMGTLDIDDTQMSNGIYSYSLIVNGQIVDTKKMELAK